jgi:hypothetical protein
MPVSKVYFSIPPLNDQATSSAGGNVSGGFSTVKGNSNIKFAISAQDRLLDTSDLYLTGRVIHVRSTGAPLTCKAAAATTLAEFNANNGANLQAYTNQNISNWGGLQNMIKRVFVQSKKSSVSISEHRNYPMFVNVRNAWTHNTDNYLVSPLIRYDAAGNEANPINRHSVLMDDCGSSTVGQMPNLLSGQSNPDFGKPFSFKLDTALLNNQMPIHLGNDYLGGLLINLELNQENGFYHNRFFDSSNGGDLNVDGSYYVLRDLRLTGRLSIPTPQDLADYSANMLLADRFNLINDVNSSVNSSKYTPNASAVRSIVNLYLDQDQENNRNKNQSDFRIPLGLQRYQQNKNNTRQPQDFVVEVVPNQLTKTKNSGAGAVDASGVTPKVGMVGDAEVRNLFQRAVLNGELADKCSVSLQTEENSIQAQYDMTRGAVAATEGVGNNQNVNALGIGIDYTFHMGETTDYRQRDYDNIVTSGVNTGDAVLPAERRSIAEITQSYIKNIAGFNSQTLIKSV